ncbi:DUF5990 family protein [Kitasatospora sp. NBC_00240]|uniref:DUF5990 family protein n=1 Tax=Kitasatospora sp. NBC_00240 TaxID=2903567 RepID=UPI00224CC9AA|nr:DUF5990 family protein [Kitasatospora sp. NBC_00240]MCX5213873.1 DUF5990 family protein [Kitasatospora sp. NBC_00240]
MLIRIEATDLPGRDCPAGGDFPGRTDVHVAVQRRGRPAELFGLRPGDAASAVWELDCSATRTPSGGPDLRGPYLQGGPGARFVYLPWGSVDAAGGFAMFRRAKLMLDAVDPAVLEAAERSGLLIARLGLTDAKGHPLCAAVRPPLVAWSAGPAGSPSDAAAPGA